MRRTESRRPGGSPRRRAARGSLRSMAGGLAATSGQKIIVLLALIGVDVRSPPTAAREVGGSNVRFFIAAFVKRNLTYFFSIAAFVKRNLTYFFSIAAFVKRNLTY